jgi:hypothetical protein
MIIKKCSFQHKYTYDMTSHKSQCAIIATKCINDIKEAFALDVTYVMLSRVTNWNNFKIIENVTPNDFTPCNFLED